MVSPVGTSARAPAAHHDAEQTGAVAQQAQALMDDSRQMGVLNAERLAQGLAAVAMQDPGQAAKLRAEIEPQLSGTEQQRLAHEWRAATSPQAFGIAPGVSDGLVAANPRMTPAGWGALDLVSIDPRVSYKPADPKAKPWSDGKSDLISSEQYDQKYAIVRNQNLPTDAAITDTGPTLRENAGTVLNAASLLATGYLGAVGAPTAALAGLSKMPRVADCLSQTPSLAKWMAPSTINSVAQTSKAAAATILADSLFDFGEKIDGVLNQEESLRHAPGDFANVIIGGNWAVPLKVGGVGFDGISLSGFTSNSSAFNGVPDAKGNTIYHDASWTAIGFRAKNNNAFVGVINGLKGLETGLYLRAVATTPGLSTAGTAKSLYINANPFSGKFLERYDMIDQYLVNSTVPKASGNFSYSIGWYQKYGTDQRGNLEQLGSNFVDRLGLATTTSMILPGATRPEPANATKIEPQGLQDPR